MPEGTDMAVMDPDRWPLFKLCLEMKTFCCSVNEPIGSRLVVQLNMDPYLHNALAANHLLGGIVKCLVEFTFLSIQSIAEQQAAS